jgi:hypothetical protein
VIVFVIICAAMSPVVPAVFALVAALFAPVVTYLLAKRQFSGRIETSDAKELWAESRAIREWSNARINVLNEVVARLEERERLLEDRVRMLEKENDELRGRLDDRIPV